MINKPTLQEMKEYVKSNYEKLDDNDKFLLSLVDKKEGSNGKQN